jgi:uncharacterized protein (DUF2147 family)
LAYLVLASVLASPVAAVSATSPDGDWARDDGLIRTHIGPCGDEICATNIWAKNPNGDEKVGDTLIMTLNAEDAENFSGKAFDPQRKSTYSMHLSVNGNKLTTRGCVLGGLLCKDASWTRIEK